MLNIRFFANRINRKLTRKLRVRSCVGKQAPFVHRAARGLRFRLVPGEYVDREIYNEGIYEIYELEFAKRFRGGVFVDIGANIGNHALYLGPYFTQVHSFEPNPIILERLIENVALNRANVTIHRSALAPTTRTCHFSPTRRAIRDAGPLSEKMGRTVSSSCRSGMPTIISSKRISAGSA